MDGEAVQKRGKPPNIANGQHHHWTKAHSLLLHPHLALQGTADRKEKGTEERETEKERHRRYQSLRRQSRCRQMMYLQHNTARSVKTSPGEKMARWANGVSITHRNPYFALFPSS